MSTNLDQTLPALQLPCEPQEHAAPLDISLVKAQSGKEVLAKLDAIDVRNATESPLLRLPREIRDMIWTAVLSGGRQSIHVVADPGNDFLRHFLCDRKSEGGSSYCAEKSSSEIIEDLKEGDEYVRYYGEFIDDADLDDAVASENEALKCIPSLNRIDPIPLLLACRQIYAEGELILYGRNTFCFQSLRAVSDFLNDRTDPQKAQIGTISILFDSHPQYHRSGEAQRFQEPPDADYLYGKKRSGLTLIDQWQIALVAATPYLKKLKTLKVSIDRQDYEDFNNSSEAAVLFYSWNPVPRYIWDALERFRLCPLEHVKISVGCAPATNVVWYWEDSVDCFFREEIVWEVNNQRNAAMFPRELREEVAEELKQMLLDPAGKAEELERWEYEQAKILRNREAMRSQSEWRSSEEDWR